MHNLAPFCISGCGSRARTYDIRLNRPALYQLSYPTKFSGRADGLRFLITVDRLARPSGLFAAACRHDIQPLMAG